MVGNASHRNRGCEAIVRGTMEILRATFGPDVEADVALRESAAELETEMPYGDPQVNLFPSWNWGSRFDRKWFAMKANRYLKASFKPYLWDLEPYPARARAALEIGGDLYSLDYGLPTQFIAYDEYLMARGLPVVLWGASVGPFDARPDFAPGMFAHLKQLAGVFVREDESREYLARHGIVENVRRVSDPAFLMEPRQPGRDKLGFDVPPGAIGINLSPLVGKFRGNSASDGASTWQQECVQLVLAAARLGRPIVLVPHVQFTDPAADDFAFLADIGRSVARKRNEPIQVAPATLNAPELKWVISQCAVFAGARTHATIAAFSTHVPTLSISYSLKARGINRDVFGHLDHCIPVADVRPETFVAHLRHLLDHEAAIRALLAERMPALRAAALAAGPMLQTLCSA